jgi:hypothetical protein
MTTTNASTPSGTLIRKIHRQPVMPSSDVWPARKPPMTGPSTLEVPKTAMKYPWYFERSRGGTMSPMIASASDMRPPAPMPCSAR